MPRKFNYFRVPTFLMVAVGLCPIGASAQITVLNQWNMGESDAGAALGGTGANSTIDSIGGWNLNEVGSPTYVAGAYSGSPLALSFANPVGGTPSQYYYNFNNTSNTYISPTSNTNWGYDFWFNCSSLPTAGGNWQPSEETMVCFGGNGGWFQANAAVEVELYNQGTTLGGTPIGMLYVSDWSGSAWTSSAAGTPAAGTWNHVVYADEDGTGYLWMNDTLVGTDAASGPVGANSGGMPAPDLSTVADNALIGCRNYGGTIAEGFDGAIDQVRLFSFAPGTFNVAETDPSATSLHPGDANGDGRVDINDLTIVLSHFGQTGTTWSQGEFTGDGTVDINDLTIVLSNFGWTGTDSGPARAVPEPAAAALLGLGVLVLLGGIGLRRCRPYDSQ